MTKESLEAVQAYLISVVEDETQPAKLRMRAAELLISLPTESDLNWMT